MTAPTEQLPQLEQTRWRLDPARSSVAFRAKTLWGLVTVKGEFTRYEGRFVSRVQVNAAINQAMVARAIELLDVRPADRVLDLYCGLGNFTLPLARRAAAVTGIEGEEGLIQRARADGDQPGKIIRLADRIRGKKPGAHDTKKAASA